MTERPQAEIAPEQRGRESRVDEFGVPKSALPAGTKYAFHGSKQREALTAGGMVAMGVRLYQPQMGRFLQVRCLGGRLIPMSTRRIR
jgi:hypothetical protein